MKEDGSQPSWSARTPHAPRLALDASLGSTNSRYSNQSRYEHMPYIFRMSGTFSHGEPPYMS